MLVWVGVCACGANGMCVVYSSQALQMDCYNYANVVLMTVICLTPLEACSRTCGE